MADFLVLGFSEGFGLGERFRYEIIEIRPQPFNQDTYAVLCEHGLPEWSSDDVEEYRTASDFDRAVLIITRNYPEAKTVDVYADVPVRSFVVKFWDHETQRITTRRVDDRYERIIEGRDLDPATDIVENRFGVWGDIVFCVDDVEGNRVWNNDEGAKAELLGMLGY